MVEIVLPEAAIKALMAPSIEPLQPRVKSIVYRLFIERTRGIIAQYDGPRRMEGYMRPTTRQVSMERVSIGAIKLHQRAWYAYPGD